MKKLTILSLTAALTLSLAGCGSSSAKASSQSTPKQTFALTETSPKAASDASVGMANPWEDYKTLEEAVKAAGFNFVFPGIMAGYEDPVFRVNKSGETIESIFKTEDAEIRFRKGHTTEDISGDYNNYKEIKTVDVNGTKVTLKGNDGNINLATWTKDGYSYSVSSTDGFDESTVNLIVKCMVNEDLTEWESGVWGPDDLVEMPNPWSEAESLDDVKKATGFDISVPESVDGVKEKSFRSCVDVDDKLAEISYVTDDDEKAYIRKGTGSEDVSGDYEEYDKVFTKEIDGMTVTFKGGEKVSLAVWEKDGYSFAIGVRDGISEDEMTTLVKEVK